MAYVGVGLRLVGTIIDLVLIYIIGYVVGLATGNSGGAGFNLQGAPALIFFLLVFAYYVVLEAQLGGRSASSCSGCGWSESTVRRLPIASRSFVPSRGSSTGSPSTSWR